MSVIVAQGPGLGPDAVAELALELKAAWEACDGFHLLTPEVFPAPARLEELRVEYLCDLNPVPAGFRSGAVGLLVSDMDSTLISIECVDEIADFAGVKSEVARITEAAMRGDLDFQGALCERVRLLAGLPETVLGRVWEERLRLNPGAVALIDTARRRGVKTAVVSGGFTFFTERLKARLGLDFALANRLEVKDGKLTGEVLGEIVDGRVKARFLRETCERLGIEPKQAVAVGDGANDLPMMMEAGLGVAYHAKPKVRARAHWAVNYNGLEAVVPALVLDDCLNRRG